VKRAGSFLRAWSSWGFLRSWVRCFGCFCRVGAVWAA